MWFASHFFSKNNSLYAVFNDQSFNDTLTNDIVSFEQLDPGWYLFYIFSRWKSIKYQKGVNLCLFGCVEVLRPSQLNGVVSNMVSLPNHTFAGQGWEQLHPCMLCHYRQMEH